VTARHTKRILITEKEKLHDLTSSPGVFYLHPILENICRMLAEHPTYRFIDWLARNNATSFKIRRTHAVCGD